MRYAIEAVIADAESVGRLTPALVSELLARVPREHQAKLLAIFESHQFTVFQIRVANAVELAEQLMSRGDNEFDAIQKAADEADIRAESVQRGFEKGWKAINAIMRQRNAVKNYCIDPCSDRSGSQHNNV